jgi:hypothetical protein
MQMRNKQPTSEQRQFLMQIYTTQGFAAAKPWAIKFGLSPKTIFHYARAAGHVGKRGRKPGEWKGKTGRTHKDPRWAKAIERGAISI